MAPDGPAGAIVRAEAVVRGVVQGVGFRWFVRGEAARLGLTGWVSNEPDGSVRVVAEGPEAAVDRLVSILHAGPPGADVSDVAVDRTVGTGAFDAFSIRSRAHRGD